MSIEKKPTLQPFRLRVRLLGESDIGLGDTVKWLLASVGLQPCRGCARRAAALNRVLVLSGPEASDDSGGDAPPGNHSRPQSGWNGVEPPASGSRRRWRLRARVGASTEGDCWWFAGSCTGFGRRQCVEGPASQNPDTEIIQQCCGGWFQYPWIEVCAGQNATQGCGFCLW
jgi:hypothetical protein